MYYSKFGLMKFLKLFLSLLRFLRVLIIGGFALIIIAAIAELFIKPTGVTWKTDSIFNVYQPYFSKTYWVIAIAIGMLLTAYCYLKVCDAIIEIMLHFKEQLYFTNGNAANFKKAAVYYVIGFLLIPVLMEVVHLIEYFASDTNRLKFIAFKHIVTVLKTVLVGLFFYVMGEVIEKAVGIRKENDLTI